MNKPLISCITPTFNRAHLLPRAIESTINQSYQDWEMIIVDDGSEDNSEEVVRGYIEKDERIKYFKNPGKGGNAARNYGIKQAKGDWIAFLDDDAESLPNRFEEQLKAASKSGSKFIQSGYISVNQQGKETICNKGIWATSAAIPSRWFIAKELLYKAGLFDEAMPAMQDNEISYRIAKYESYANHFVIVCKEYQSKISVSKGMNGTKGAELLLEKHLPSMPKDEAAWWYYKIGRGYLMQENMENLALKNFRISAQVGKSLKYKLMGIYFMFLIKLNISNFKRLNLRILELIVKLPPRKIVQHRTIT